jgi:hypothetical protein
MSGTTTTPSNPAPYTDIATNDGITAWRDAKDNKWDASGKPVVYSAGNNGWIVPAVNQRFEINSNLVPTNIVNAGTTIITIPKGFGTGIWQSAFLQLNFTETGGVSPVTLMPAPYIISNNQGLGLAFNGGGSIDWSSSADAIYAGLQGFSNEKITQAFAFNQMNMSATNFASPTAIPAGGSATYMIPLTGLPLLGLSQKTLQGDAFLYVTYNNSCVIAGAGTATLTGVKLILTSHRNDKADPSADYKISKSVYVNPICRWMNITIPPQNMALGYNLVPLAGLVDSYVGALCVMLRSNKTGAGLYTFASISGGTALHTASIDLQSSNGLTILGSGALTEAFMRSQSQFMESPGIMSSIIPINWIYLSSEPFKFMVSGDGNAGGMQLGPNQNLVIQTAGSFVPGTYTIDVYFLTRQSVRQANGNVQVIKG